MKEKKLFIWICLLGLKFLYDTCELISYAIQCRQPDWMANQIPSLLIVTMAFVSWFIAKKENKTEKELAFLKATRIVMGIQLVMLILIKIIYIPKVGTIDPRATYSFLYSKILTWIGFKDTATGLVDQFKGMILMFKNSWNYSGYQVLYFILTIVTFISYSGICVELEKSILPSAPESNEATGTSEKKNFFAASFGSSFKNFLVFKGYSSRRETLTVLFFVNIALQAINFDTAKEFYSDELNFLFYLLFCLINVVFYLPLFSSMTRRLHDAGVSGFFLLIPLVNIYMLIQPSKPNSKFDSETRATAIGKFLVLLNLAVTVVIMCIFLYQAFTWLF